MIAKMLKRALLALFVLVQPLVYVNAQEFPTPNRLISVSPSKILDAVSDVSDRSKTSPKVDRYIEEIVAGNNLNIVLKDAIYATLNLDITNETIRAYKANTPAKNINLSAIKANPIIGAINTSRVFNESSMSKQMTRTLQTEFTQRQEDLRAEARKLKDLAQKLDSEAATMSPEMRLSRQQDLGAIDKLLSAKMKVFTEDLNRRTVDEQTKIRNAYIPIIKLLSEYQGINLVFDAAAYITPELDITSDVIAILNNERTVSEIKKRDVFKRPTKVGTLDAEELFAAFPNKTSKDVVLSVNSALRDYCVVNNIDIIFESPIHTGRKFDITSQIISSVKSK